MCMYCKNNTTVNSTTTHVVNYKDCIIVIKNVPALNVSSAARSIIRMKLLIGLKGLLIWPRS